MRRLTTSALAVGTALLLGLAGASPSLAKGHSQGVGGGGATGPGTGERTSGTQSNSPDAAMARGDDVGGPGRSGTSYGQVDASNAEDGGRSGNSNREAAQAPR
jgi:hypothetical protein